MNEEETQWKRRQCEATEKVANAIQSLKWFLMFAILLVGLGLEFAITNIGDKI